LLLSRDKHRRYGDSASEKLYLEQQQRQRREELDFSKLSLDELDEFHRLVIKAISKENEVTNGTPA